MRLVDELRKKGIKVDHVFYAQEVHDEVALKAENRMDVTKLEDYPCLAPPYDQYAVCFHSSKNFRGADFNMFNGGKEVEYVAYIDAITDYRKLEDTDIDPSYRGRVKWSVVMSIAHNTNFPFNLYLVYYLDKDGVVLPVILDDGKENKYGSVGIVANDNMTNGKGRMFLDMDDDAISNIMWSMAWLTFTALQVTSMLHCSNVTFKDEERDEGITRSYNKKNRIVGVKYKILVISDTKTASRKSSKTKDTVDRTVPQHNRRGHFAIYKDKPLFGKFRGTIWIPDHVVGSKANGIVVKDYKMTTKARKEA